MARSMLWRCRKLVYWSSKRKQVEFIVQDVETGKKIRVWVEDFEGMPTTERQIRADLERREFIGAIDGGDDD